MIEERTRWWIPDYRLELKRMIRKEYDGTMNRVCELECRQGRELE